jgi:hypothetical protein
MEEYQSLIGVISLTMGVSWASGINLYAAILMLGLAGTTGSIELPAGLETLENPLVIGAAGLMYLVEFFADKIPGVDSTWDALHTFVRIPAGALLAMGSVGDVTPALEVAAGILGGGMAMTSHATKAGARLAVNASPEPFTNWGLSISEDVAVFAGLWAALAHPWIFVCLMVLFIVLAIWLLPKIWRAVKFIFRKIGQLLGIVDKNEAGESALATVPHGSLISSSPVDELDRLKRLLDEGAISQDEFDTLKKRHI